MILQKSKKSPDAEQTSGLLAVPFYPNLSANRLAISSKNSSLSTPRAWKPGSTSPSRSFVITPSFSVSREASSSAWPNCTSSGRPSSSPRRFKPPDQAKMVAMGLVEVFSPFRYL